MKVTINDGLIEYIKKFNPKCIYRRHLGAIDNFEVHDENIIVHIPTGIALRLNEELLGGIASGDILDLIEPGDIVNGKLVSNVDKVENKHYIEWENGEMYSTEIPNDKFIKSILTKEMYRMYSFWL